MAQAEHGDTVAAHYTGASCDGTVFETSDGGEPLRFRIGVRWRINARQLMIAIANSASITG